MAAVDKRQGHSNKIGKRRHHVHLLDHNAQAQRTLQDVILVGPGNCATMAVRSVDHLSVAGHSFRGSKLRREFGIYLLVWLKGLS